MYGCVCAIMSKIAKKKDDPNWWHEEARAGRLSEDQIKILTERQIARKAAERKRRLELSKAVRSFPMPNSSPTKVTGRRRMVLESVNKNERGIDEE